MNLEDKVKSKLLDRGFTKTQLINNRGLIGAIIDITQDVKNLTIPVVMKQSELLRRDEDKKHYEKGWNDGAEYVYQNYIPKP